MAVQIVDLDAGGGSSFTMMARDVAQARVIIEQETLFAAKDSAQRLRLIRATNAATLAIAQAALIPYTVADFSGQLYTRIQGLMAMRQEGRTSGVLLAGVPNQPYDAIIARYSPAGIVEKWGKIGMATWGKVGDGYPGDVLDVTVHGVESLAQTLRLCAFAPYGDGIKRIVGRQWTLDANLVGIPTTAAPVQLVTGILSNASVDLRARALGSSLQHTWLAFLDYGGSYKVAKSIVWHQDGTTTTLWSNTVGMADYAWFWLDTLSDPLVANAGWMVLAGKQLTSNRGVILIQRLTSIDHNTPTVAASKFFFLGINETILNGVSLTLANKHVTAGTNRLVILAAKSASLNPFLPGPVLRWVCNAALTSFPVQAEDQGYTTGIPAMLSQANKGPVSGQYSGTDYAGLTAYLNGGKVRVLLTNP